MKNMQRKSKHRDVFLLDGKFCVDGVLCVDGTLCGSFGCQSKVYRYLASSFQDQPIIFSENLGHSNNSYLYELLYALDDSGRDYPGCWYWLECWRG